MSDKLHIVIVLNASEPSQYAIKWAMDNFLDPLRHRVTILTVVEPPIQTGYYYAASAGNNNTYIISSILYYQLSINNPFY